MSFIEKGNEYGVDQLLSGTGHKVMELFKYYHIGI